MLSVANEPFMLSVLVLLTRQKVFMQACNQIADLG